jgi:hypothetical protein
VFNTNVAKLDRDVTYVVMVVHECASVYCKMFCVFLDVCCKCVYLDVACVSHIVFYLDVAYNLQWLFKHF